MKTTMFAALLLVSTLSFAQTLQPARRLSGKILNVSQYDSLTIRVYEMATMELIETKVYKAVHKGDFYQVVFHTFSKVPVFYVEMVTGQKRKDVYVILANMGHEDLIVDVDFIRNSTIFILRDNANKDKFTTTEIKENGLFETITRPLSY